MSRQRKNPGHGEAPITRVRGGARDRLRDAGSKELAQLAKKVGNGQVGALLGASRAKRDALLAFIQRRLAQVRAAQVAEQRELSDKREWWQRVSRGKPGFHVPDPTKWGAVAQLYKQASDAICAGDLGRGAHVLDRAVRAERAAFEAVPTQVELPSVIGAPVASADERPFVEEGEGCPPTQAPEVTRLAGEIVRVSESMDPVPSTPSLRGHHWWEGPDEELEDLKKKTDEKQSPASGPAARAIPSLEPGVRAKGDQEGPAKEQTLAPERERQRRKKPVHE